MKQKYIIYFVKGLCKKLPNRLSTWHFNLNKYFYRVCPGTPYDTWLTRSSMVLGWLVTMRGASWTPLQRCSSMITCSALISNSTKATVFPNEIAWISTSNMLRWDTRFQWNFPFCPFGEKQNSLDYLLYKFCYYSR